MNRMAHVIAASCVLLGIGSVTLLGGVGAAPSAPAMPATTTADSYKIDAVHSTALFRINHAGAGIFWGRFNQIEGEFNLDPEHLDASHFKVTIPIAGIDTNNSKRDEHLRSGDFFNARQYPTAQFESTSVEATDDPAVFRLKGDLTIMGQTHPVTARLLYGGEGNFQGKVTKGFEADFVIKRGDFGITTYLAPDGSNAGGLGNDVRIIVAGEGNKQ